MAILSARNAAIGLGVAGVMCAAFAAVSGVPVDSSLASEAWNNFVASTGVVLKGSAMGLDYGGNWMTS